MLSKHKKGAETANNILIVDGPRKTFANRCNYDSLRLKTQVPKDIKFVRNENFLGFQLKNTISISLNYTSAKVRIIFLFAKFSHNFLFKIEMLIALH